MSVIKSYPQTMTAVFPDKTGTKLVAREVKTPDPGPGDVLIKIAAAPVNPSDIRKIKEVMKSTDSDLFIPGIEGSGTVIAAGKGLLSRLWMGKRVACSSGYITSGTWAEYMVTPAAMCFPLKKKVNDEQGSMTLVNPLSALEFFEIVKKNRHKAIINNAAASALGRMVELLGEQNGIPVINLVRNQKQSEILRNAGSRHVLNTSDPTFIENLGSLSAQLHATLLFDSVCNRQIPDMIDALPHGSSVIIYGNLSGEEHIMINPLSLITNNIKISGFYLGNQAKVNGLLKNMFNLRKAGNLMSRDMKIKIKGRFPLIKVQEAVEVYLENMSEGKVLLVPGLTV